MKRDNEEEGREAQPQRYEVKMRNNEKQKESKKGREKKNEKLCWMDGRTNRRTVELTKPLTEQLVRDLKKELGKTCTH